MSYDPSFAPPAPIPRRRRVSPCKAPLRWAGRRGVDGKITAVIGPDNLIRGYLITGRLTPSALRYLEACHYRSDFLWCVSLATQWKLSLVYARRSWIDSQMSVPTAPSGLTLTIS